MDTTTPIEFVAGSLSGSNLTRMVRVTQDGKIEQDETFVLRLQTDLPLVILVSPMMVQVTIMSDDGK